VEGWAYSNRARGLIKHAPPEFRISAAPLQQPDGRLDPEPALGDSCMDVLFVMHNDPDRARIVHQAVFARGWRPSLVGAWNAGWPLDIETFPDRYREADLLIVNNHFAWEKLGRPARTVCCPNGVDLDIFRLTRPLEVRQPLVLWSGSERWREVKGYDDYVAPLQRRLSQLGIATDFRLVDSNGGRNRTPEAMAEWYNSGTVLLCASATEGTPNPALEAAACGCVVVSTPVGNMLELIRTGVNGYLVERSVEALLKGVLAAVEDYPRLASQMQWDIQGWGWHARSGPYFEAFRAAFSGPRPDRRKRDEPAYGVSHL
jgi:glycosyltransferase involved in cell wall biosynthesis